MKEILKYIQLYTGCNDHALKRIEAMLEPRLNKEPQVIEKIVEVERIISKKLPAKMPIEFFADGYYQAHNTSFKELVDRSRRQDVVDKRNDFIKAAYLNGYTCTGIARFLNRNHSTILYAIHK